MDEENPMQNTTSTYRDIKTRRMQLNMSQEQLAYACDLPLDRIVKAESSGTENFTLLDIIKLASGLHMLEVEKGYRHE